MNMQFPSREIVEKVRTEYPIGCRVELEKMDDVQAPPIETRGTVVGVDDTASLMVDWDNGSHLNVVYGEDKVRKLFVIPKEVVEQAIKIRDTGRTNMFDTLEVQLIADEMGLNELRDFIASNRSEYLNLILYGNDEI